MKALTEHGQSVPVMDLIRRDLPRWIRMRCSRLALMRLQESGTKTLPVTHGGQLVGMVTTENITEFLMIRSALKAASKVPQPF